MFKIHIVGSSSKGNTIIAENDNLVLFLDAGMSPKKVSAFISDNNIDMTKKKMMFISHRHLDHAKYENHYIVNYGVEKIDHKPEYVFFDNNVYKYLQFDCLHYETDKVVGEIEVENKGIYFVDNISGDNLLYMIDTSGTTDFDEKYQASRLFNLKALGIQTIIIEANHDQLLLWEGDYDIQLKNRVSKSHMRNSNAMIFVSKLLSDKTKQVIFTHLSENNNTPESVLSIMKEVRDASIGMNFAMKLWHQNNI